MTNLYFACLDCKSYIDAGYRWCYWTLEKPGIVSRKIPLSVDSVLKAEEYWNASKGEGDPKHQELLAKTLAKARDFLNRHKTHHLTYGEDEDFFSFNDYTFLDWSEENSGDVFLVPRDFVERFGLKTWKQVENYVNKNNIRPLWWHDGKTIEEAKKRFLKIVSK
jgi:hypothetical protein